MNAIGASATLCLGAREWCAEFQHPSRSGAGGNQGPPVRRRLRTQDQAEAQLLLAQLNEIIADPTLWDLDSLASVKGRFDPRVLEAFRGTQADQALDPWAIRDEAIPLPGGPDSDDGYGRVLFVGTTGAGKTTVIRQLIGTDPERERFPSISAAKTTICDMELVLDQGPYRAVVTFLPRDLVRQYISECLMEAVMATLEGALDREVRRRFLEHSEQRFRLSYVLGNPSYLGPTDSEDLEEDEAVDSPPDDSDALTDAEREELLRTLLRYFSGIDGLAEEGRNRRQAIASDHDIDLAAVSPDDRAAIQELLEDDLAKLDEYTGLVNAILVDVESRFGLLSDGDVTRGPDAWPTKWTYEGSDRARFLRLVNRFSSNYGPLFGRLLTPLVDGIRVAGPFSPDWHEGGTPRLVLMDGEGIGHVADSTSSLSTSVTGRFRVADAIVLVDNAAQPMQAAPCKVLETLVTSGHESKLVVVFTHFEAVRGDNLRGLDAKKDHVISSFDNASNAIGRNHGSEAGVALRRLAPDRLVFLANGHKRASEILEPTRMELRRLLHLMESAVVPVEPSSFQPIYDTAGLVLASQKATQEFHDRWNGILGMDSRSQSRPEHWTRVKALSRRLGEMGQDEYDTLRPVADLKALLMTHLSRFLASPTAWFPFAPPEDGAERTQAIDAIRRDVHDSLGELSRRRVMEQRIAQWVAAYEHRGRGSTRVRAADIASIYGAAAPTLDAALQPSGREFLSDVGDLLAECVLAGGGRLIGWETGSRDGQAAGS